MNFRTKTILGIAVIEVILLVILVISAMSFLVQSNKSQLNKRIDNTTSMFSTAVSNAVLTRDLATLDAMLDNLMQLDDLVYAKVVAEGEVIAYRGEHPNSIIPTPTNRAIDFQDSVVSQAINISVAGQSFGFIEIGLATSSIHQIINQARRSIIAIASVEVLLVALFSVFLGSYLTNNLKRLQKAAQTIHRKGPGHQVCIQQNDELGDVANAFNQMSVGLEKSYKQIDQARKEAEHASETKSRFLAAMSHEIRTPLNGVLGVLSSLNNTELSQEQRGLVHTAANSGNLLLSLISNILDVSKIDSHSLVLENETFHFKQEVESLLRSFLPIAERKNIAFTVTFDELPPYVIGDKTRYQQILLNLVGNALKFTEQGSIEVAFTVSQADQHLTTLVCQVSDTGVGIACEHLPHLFDEFTMVDNTYSRTSDGSGLGLAICKKLTTLMEGRIEVESQIGKGSRFTLSIPFEIGHQTQLKGTLNAPAQLSPECQDCRILVAEDNKANQIVIKNMLKNVSRFIDVADNGIQALEQVQNHHYDLVFMDVSMPEMDGLTACKKIRDMDDITKSSLPIIAFTAHALSGDEEKFLAAGMSGYLSKPVSLAKLIETINHHVGLDQSTEHKAIAAVHPQMNQTPPKSSPLPISDTSPTGKTSATSNESEREELGDSVCEDDGVEIQIGLGPKLSRIRPEETSQPPSGNTKRSALIHAEPSNEADDETAPLVDEETLQQMVRDAGPDVIPMIIDHYVAETSEHKDKIDHALGRKDLEALQFEAHKLISSSRALGNHALSDLARDVESACIEQQTDRALQLASGLNTLTKHSLEALIERKKIGFEPDEQPTV